MPTQEFSAMVFGEGTTPEVVGAPPGRLMMGPVEKNQSTSAISAVGLVAVSDVGEVSSGPFPPPTCER